MIPNQKYRFFILNTCDYSDSYTGTSVAQFITTNIEIGAHNFAIGDYAFFEGFARGINGVQRIVDINPTYIMILIHPLVDASILGTVKKISPRYVNPLNFYETKFEWQQEQDEIFFRKLFNDPLKFTGADYNYFRDNILPNECCEVKFVIEKRCSDLGLGIEFDPQLVQQTTIRTEQSWNEEWRGTFTHNSCNWNLSHCWVEATFELDDFYRCLLYGIDDAQTVFDVITYFERLECCAEKNLEVAPGGPCDPPCVMIFDAIQNDGSGGVEFNDQHTVGPCDDSERSEWQIEKIIESQITFSGDTFELFNSCYTWIREVAISMDIAGVPISPSGSGWVVREAINYNGMPAHKWTRLPYGGAYYMFSDYTHTHDCDADPCTHMFQVNFPDVLDSHTSQKPLSEVGSALVLGACPSLSGMRSDFFEINPPGDTPGYVAGTNYVTGVASKINNLGLIQVSSFLTVISGTVEEIVSDMTLKQLLDALKIFFNCKWFVDDDGYVRIEHISWFQRTVGIDTTIGSDNIRRNKSKKQFKFDKQEIPLREKFNCVYQGYLDFVGKDIKYDSPCVNPRKTNTYTVPKFSTDLQNIRDKASDVNDFNSFILLARDSGDDVLSEVGELSGDTIENVHLGWANLHENYYKYHRFLPQGYMNDALTNFLSVRKTKRQVPIQSIGCCRNPNPLYDLVKTDLGDGQIDKMSKDNRDEDFTFELLY